MRRIDVSTKNVSRFAGKWVVIDSLKEKIIAVGETLTEISPLVTHSTEKNRPSGKNPFFDFIISSENRMS